MTGQRMAPHTPQESPRVKTRCVRVGSTRLYAPMVPLAPHPCVRWWNTEEMSLKLTRLGLHSLRGGSTHQNHPISVGAGSVWVVGVWQPYGCVVVRDHSLPGQRMAPHTPQESPKVKTRCFRVGSTRLYAPMVPLAPHPCVRWWNTEEMPLKLTRLGLHSLRGGSSHQKPSHPVGAGALTRQPLSRKPPTQAAWIPTNKGRYSTPSTAVAQKGPRVAQTQAAENRRISQRILPEEQPNKIGPLSCCTAPPQDFHWSIFSFSESRTAFSFESKEKAVLAPAGQADKQPPVGQAKNNCKIKRTTFPQKRKRFYLPHP